MLVGLTSCSDFRVLCSVACILNIWKSCSCPARELWIMWSSNITTAMGRNMKTRKIRSQVFTGLRCKWRVCVLFVVDSRIPVSGIQRCSVCNQLRAFLRCGLFITLSWHHSGPPCQTFPNFVLCYGTKGNPEQSLHCTEIDSAANVLREQWQRQMFWQLLTCAESCNS